jgi:hypothetical protein
MPFSVAAVQFSQVGVSSNPFLQISTVSVLPTGKLPWMFAIATTGSASASSGVCMETRRAETALVNVKVRVVLALVSLAIMVKV